MMQLKKSLGQHFLTDKNVIQKILEALQELTFSHLLEVGPGGGALTGQLLQIPDIRFKAVELDQDKVVHLLTHFPEIKDKLIQGSFLEIPKPFEESFTIIGNFPYNISTEIVFRILDWKETVPSVIGMFQKEVAARLAAAPGSKMYGVTSALVQPFYKIRYLFDVPPSCFHPPPKVMSGVISMVRSDQVLNLRSEQDYRTLVKTAFNQRRKMLRNAVRGLFEDDILKEKIFDLRAEQLDIEQFAELTFRMRPSAQKS
jgi:16S rRNA (adenine1518-N6/adenine1519-N6)-dimethyltransferase